MVAVVPGVVTVTVGPTVPSLASARGGVLSPPAAASTIATITATRGMSPSHSRWRRGSVRVNWERITPPALWGRPEGKHDRGHLSGVGALQQALGAAAA